jgi:hypothetical protein
MHVYEICSFSMVLGAATNESNDITSYQVPKRKSTSPVEDLFENIDKFVKHVKKLPIEWKTAKVRCEGVEFLILFRHCYILIQNNQC